MRLHNFGPTWPEVPAAKDGSTFVFKTKNGSNTMSFFTSAVSTLQNLVVALGAVLAVWGVINLLEGYGSDNPSANTPVRKKTG